MNGKGSAPRPFSVNWAKYADAWARTFATPHPVRLTSTDLSVDSDTLSSHPELLSGGDPRRSGVHESSPLTRTSDEEDQGR